ncbi:DNA-binding response regulator [Spirochaetia bacterium]|nr:DNA-binding response regulator [Spirochaetia bacterium]GHV88177.1 DNA-binding response regulator [Spirochaetia bacterium]
MQKVCIVEDDDNIREMVLYALSSAGFEAEGFTSGEAFYTRLLKEAPSLILLDIMLPGEDGISLLKKLKQAEKTKLIPVIMLTAKGTELDRIKGLDLGADDYITKPFSVMEAISRVKAVLRRCEGSEKSESNADKPGKVTVGSVTLHSDRRVVFAGDTEIALTYKEFELLYYLMHHKGIVVRRDTLLNQVWGFDYAGETRTVDMHIKSLRKKMGTAGDMIKTVRNVGYKIEG